LEHWHFTVGLPIQRKAKVKCVFDYWRVTALSASVTLIQLTINGNPRDFEQAKLTVSELVTTLGLEGKRLAIERNGEIVPRSLFIETSLNTGDQLEIVGAVGGG
jgi:sulfur carrier protein